MAQSIHIIAFDIPCHPLYGGTIDVFYKIKSLHHLGIEVILHCFEYGEHKSIEGIRPYCKEILVYPRKSIWSSFFTKLPYIVNSRSNDQLLQNLIKNDCPILMEGVHSTYFINHPLLKHRSIWVWNHNIEKDYYRSLSDATNNLIRKLFFKLESIRLEWYEKQLECASGIFGVSKKDAKMLGKQYKVVHYLPAFHKNTELTCKTGRGAYILYHGNLSVIENQMAVLWLIEFVFSKISYPVIIAGKEPNEEIIKAVEPSKHIQLKSNISEKEMIELQNNAQIHTLITFQDTGIKHKLLNALFVGRFVLVNESMVRGAGLEGLTVMAETADDIIDKIDKLMAIDFEETNIMQRKSILEGEFDNLINAQKLISIIFGKM